MYTGTGLPLTNTRIGNVIVPPGDQGEQLVAYLILSILASHLHSDESTNGYVSQAHTLAVRLADQCLTYRPPQPSKFARLTSEIDGTNEIILLSMIDNILVVPEISPRLIARDHLTVPPTIKINDLEVVYFMIRLRTRRIMVALERLMTMAPGEQFNKEARHILKECVRNEIPSAEPLALARDYLTLASNLVRKRHFPLVTLALRNADSVLDLCMKGPSIIEHSDVVQTMKDQITSMLDEIRQTGN